MTQQAAGHHEQSALQPTAQAQSASELLKLLTTNQQVLVCGLLHGIVIDGRRCTKPATAVFFLYRELTKRTFRALGESEGQSYCDCLTALRDNPSATIALAEEAVTRAQDNVPRPDAPTDPQLRYLKMLGCNEVPKTRKAASQLIEKLKQPKGGRR